MKKRKISIRCNGLLANNSQCRVKTLSESGYCHFHFHQSKVEDIHQERCCICLDSVKKNDVLACGHTVHMKCLKGCCKCECPVCRTPLAKGVPTSVKNKILTNANQLKKERDEEEAEMLRQEQIEHEWIIDLLENIMSDGTFPEHDDECSCLMCQIRINLCLGTIRICEVIETTQREM